MSQSGPKRNRQRLAGLASLLLALFSLTSAVAAQSPTRVVTDDEVNAIAKELYCPVCESTPLDVCPTQACADWRQVVRTKLSEGQTEEEIKAYFETQYGARALAEPPRQGFTLAVWVVPIIALVIAAFLFSRYLRNLRTASGIETLPVANTTSEEKKPDYDEYQARIERELQERGS